MKSHPWKTAKKTTLKRKRRIIRDEKKKRMKRRTGHETNVNNEGGVCMCMFKVKDIPNSHSVMN